MVYRRTFYSVLEGVVGINRPHFTHRCALTILDGDLFMSTQLCTRSSSLSSLIHYFFSSKGTCPVTWILIWWKDIKLMFFKIWKPSNYIWSAQFALISWRILMLCRLVSTDSVGSVYKKVWENVIMNALPAEFMCRQRGAYGLMRSSKVWWVELSNLFVHLSLLFYPGKSGLTVVDPCVGSKSFFHLRLGWNRGKWCCRF